MAQRHPAMGSRKLYVIARTAFGDLYVWGDRCANTIDITPMNILYCLTTYPKNLLLKNKKSDILVHLLAVEIKKLPMLTAKMISPYLKKRP